MIDVLCIVAMWSKQESPPVGWTAKSAAAHGQHWPRNFFRACKFLHLIASVIFEKIEISHLCDAWRMVGPRGSIFRNQ